jgi:hypothetical protein
VRVHSILFHVSFLSNLQRAPILMSKRRNDDALKDNSQATAKRARYPTGFRAARPTASSSSTLTSSHIRTLVLGSDGRLASRRKDKSHLTTTQTPSTPAPIQADTSAVNVIPSTADLPEDAFQAASTDVQTEPKPKRKRDNKNRVCDSTITSATDSNSI